MFNLVEMEIAVNIFLQNLGVWLVAPMHAITALGYEQFFILLLPTIYWCFDQMTGLRVGVIFLIGNVVNNFFKILFRSPRPYWVSKSVKAYSFESSFGLPSGHAQIAATMWGWLAVEIKKRWFRITALVLIFLIGLSRLYLGVHFLRDVLLGWLLGGLLVWVFSARHEKVGKWLNQKKTGLKLILVSGSAILFLLMIMGARWIPGGWQMPDAWAERAGDIDPLSLDGAFTLSGTWFGMLGGYVLLTATKGHFYASEGGWQRLARFVVGLVGLFVLYFGLGQLFPDNADFISYALRFLRYTLIGLWVSWWGPLMFEKIGLLRFQGKPHSLTPIRKVIVDLGDS